jgi:lipid II:glycine glycyltransferase (peptidoglycan interpeptide bridge formation enzyme)
VDKSPVSSFFQTRECYDFYTSLSFLKPFVFGISENEKLVGLLCGYIMADGGRVKQFFSRRAIVPGGVLLDSTISENALQKLLNFTIKSLKNEVIYIEMRNYLDYSDFRSVFEKSGYCYQRHLNFHVQTQSAETVYKQLSSTKRRDIKVSEKAGAETVELTTNAEIEKYYAILKNLYKTRIKLPLFPIEFFTKFIHLKENKIWGIKYNGKIIGGSVCTYWNNVVYEWFVCGKDGHFKNVYPSSLATWSSILYAANNGYQYVDMMGAGKVGEYYGVREFKAKFGGELVEYGRFLCICHKLLYRIGKFYIEKIKKIC